MTKKEKEQLLRLENKIDNSMNITSLYPNLQGVGKVDDITDCE